MDDNEIVNKWSGLRPVTPDDVPIISDSPLHSNLYINTGHGSKGLI